MKKVYLLLGSNMGNSLAQLKKAKSLIQKQVGKVSRASAYYSTAAWGNTNQPDFLNQVIVISTKLKPEEVLAQILLIEKSMGRIRTVKNAPRIIDIDILFYEKEIINEKDLIVPHPLIQERKFVLIPLNELSPNFIHPVFKKNIHELLVKCKDNLPVQKK
jgi:2-amino-4-hydroxy-6-hydroxymethyldihydropteridine diphosphokinase